MESNVQIESDVKKAPQTGAPTHGQAQSMQVTPYSGTFEAESLGSRGAG